MSSTASLETVASVIENQARLRPHARAIAASNRRAMTFDELFRQLKDTGAELNRLGLGRGDRVVLVLPNGPEMAAAFVCLGASTTVAPLNPSYKLAELNYYLDDLKPNAVVVQAGLATPVVSAAKARGIPLIELHAESSQPAGKFVLRGPQIGPCKKPGLAEPSDLVLILHTSGTTSRPKMVPLAHSNVAASTHHIRESLQLTERDSRLNVMPLFHVQGLVGGLLSTLAAGGSYICATGFDVDNFFELLHEFKPTWFSAVPTMYQAILAHAPQYRSILAEQRLRFIRVGSYALSAREMKEVESLFGVPAIESYGMTEAASQIAVNPLPPGMRKFGSVGFVSGPEVVILDERGEPVPCGTTGEIAIRGSNVTTGYLDNPEANAQAFVRGWLRTGDLGYFDSDGYLYLKGRIKELINRGGEKFAPREIDEVLLEHPAVAQAVTFAVSDPALGEDVAAAIVLTKEGMVSAAELREFAQARLAHFKVPRQIVILTEMPKGPTGKVQRIGMAERLNLTSLRGARPAEPDEDFVVPRNEVENAICTIWAKTLGLERVSAQADFFQLGGDSIRALQVAAHLEKELKIDLPVEEIFDNPSVSKLAVVIEQRSDTRKRIAG